MGDVEPAPGVRVVAERDGQQRARVEGGHERARDADVPGRVAPSRRSTSPKSSASRPPRRGRTSSASFSGTAGSRSVSSAGSATRFVGAPPSRAEARIQRRVCSSAMTRRRLRVVEGADRLEDAGDGAIDAEPRVGERGHLSEQREPRPRPDLVACPHRGEVPEHEQVERPDDEPARLELRPTLRGERADRGDAHGGGERHGEAGRSPRQNDAQRIANR